MASRSKAMEGKSATSIRLDQGHRNSIISGEALKKRIPDIFLFLPIWLFDFRQPLISGEARASPVSSVPTPLKMVSTIFLFFPFLEHCWMLDLLKCLRLLFFVPWEISTNFRKCPIFQLNELYEFAF